MFTVTFFYALCAGIIPSLIWLYFWTREDTANPESKMSLAISFCAGMLVVFLAIFAEKYSAPILNTLTARYTVWAAIEEIAKLLAVSIVALRTTQNDEPIDAMIYCITVALGFAALENAFFILQPLWNGEILQSIVTGNMRFIGATLVHVVSSATIGFAVGYTFYKKRIYKVLAAIIGLIIAITLHAGFNLSIINGGTYNALQTFGWVWGAVVIVIVLFEEIKAVRPRFV